MVYQDPDWPLGYEKAATTPTVFAIVRGVKISSRYQKQHEMETLAQMVAALRLPWCVSEIWCNSKQTHDWHVALWPAFDHPVTARIVAEDIHTMLLQKHDGYNALSVGSHFEETGAWPDELFDE
jgi:hypothetical protein